VLKPINRLLKLIEFKGTWVEIKLPTFDDAGHYAYALRMIFAAIEEFFNIGFDQRRLNTQLVGDVFLDALMNAAKHGNQKDLNKKIIIGLWFGRNGVLFGIQDERDFFRKQSTKELVELQAVFASTGEDSCGIGMTNIYQADEVHVSTEENVLYVVILAESMIIKRHDG